MFSKKIFVTVSIFVLFSSFDRVWAQDEDGSYLGYDAIVSDLNSSNAVYTAPQSEDPFDSIQIHGSMGLVTSHLTLETNDGKTFAGFQNGFEANLGIDLFSEHWMAEGGLRSYSTAALDKVATVSLHEFNLRLVYRNPFTRLVKMRLGMGLAARYLELQRLNSGIPSKEEHSTPASILSMGLEATLTKSLSVGAEISYRSAMISDSADRSSADATLKLGAHF